MLQLIVLLPLILLFIAVWIQMAVLMFIWRKAWIGGVHVSFARLMFMSFRLISPTIVCNAAVKLHRAGVEFEIPELESDCREGLDIERIGDAAILAQLRGVTAAYDGLAEMLKSGIDPLERIRDDPAGVPGSVTEAAPR